MDAAKLKLPWVERYRPANLDGLASQKEISSTLKKFLDEKKLPHLLFYGPPGTGKTSTILAIAKQLYSPTELRSQVLELNASDDRGISVVREEILTFASLKSVFGRSQQCKLVILDEADSMTKDAQMALRRIIEKFTDSTRFCIICNYLNKIIPALQSRCMRFRFAPLDPEIMSLHLRTISGKETVNIDDNGIRAVVKLSRGDMRAAINMLQSVYMVVEGTIDEKKDSSKIDEEVVYRVAGQPSPSDVECVMRWMLNEDFLTITTNIRELQRLKGFALPDLLREVHNFMERVEVPAEALGTLVRRLADVEYRLSHGAVEKLQLSDVVAAFVETRQVIGATALSKLGVTTA